MNSEHGANFIGSYGREYPPRPIPSVHAVVLQGELALLVKRAHEPSRGRWSVPGGVIELGETVHDAARRELCEECGVEIEVDRVIEVLDNLVWDGAGRVRFHYVLIYVLARYVRGEVHSGSDALDARWVTRDEVDALDMHSRGKEIVQRAFKMARRPASH